MVEEDRGAETNDSIIIPATLFKEQNSEILSVFVGKVGGQTMNH